MSPTSPVTIETERLILRGHRLDDFPAYIPLWTQRLAGPDGGYRFPPLRDEEVWNRLLRWIGHRYVFGFAPFLVFDRQSGCFAGEVGFGHFHRGHGDAFDKDPEGMWTLHPDFHGKGLAGEAVAAAIAWIDENVRPARTVCMIAPDNEPSLRIARRFGYRAFAQASYKGEMNVLLERLMSQGGMA